MTARLDTDVEVGRAAAAVARARTNDERDTIFQASYTISKAPIHNPTFGVSQSHIYTQHHITTTTSPSSPLSQSHLSPVHHTIHPVSHRPTFHPPRTWPFPTPPIGPSFPQVHTNPRASSRTPSSLQVDGPLGALSGRRQRVMCVGEGTRLRNACRWDRQGQGRGGWILVGVLG